MYRELVANVEVSVVPGVDDHSSVQHLRCHLHVLAKPFCDLRIREAFSHAEVHPWVVPRVDCLGGDRLRQLIISLAVALERANGILHAPQLVRSQLAHGVEPGSRTGACGY